MDKLSSPESMAETFDEALRLLAKISESGAALDPAVLTGVRQNLKQKLYILGALDKQGNVDPNHFCDIAIALARKKDTPIKPENYPEYDVFLQAFAAFQVDQPVLFTDVSLRQGKSLESYLYGLGIVMANKDVYESVFETDSIVVKAGQVQNGRHRTLARGVLDKSGYNTQSWSWIKTEVEM